MLQRMINYPLGLKFALRKVRLGISSTDLVLDVGGGITLIIERMLYARNLSRRVRYVPTTLRQLGPRN